jgi:hypothetical protein
MEIQRMWNVKTKVIPVITGVTGNISETFSKYVTAHRESSGIREHCAHTAEGALVKVTWEMALYVP